ncbi:hypothetical protein KR038_002228, partial [Drosophila bunnanda]
MNLLKLILCLPLILANGGLATGNLLLVRSPVKTMDIDGFHIIKGGHVGSWVLRIMKDTEFACGASHISALYGVTSANCLQPYRSNLSSLRVQLIEEEQDEPSFARVSTIFVSKDWRWPDTYMDLAVIKMSNRLGGSREKFVRLCSKPLAANDRLELVACGKEVRVESISVLDRMECDSQYENLILRETVACGQEFTKTKACMFEAGCPVTAGEELCGIVAWAPSTCQRKRPGIFTDLYQARHFIKKVISGK